MQNNTVSGKANNVYLPSGKTLTIEIGMSKGASVGVTTANTSYPVAFSNNYKKDYSNYFFADDANAHVEYKDDQKLYLVSGAVARPLTVTFDPNGGMLAEADKTKSLMTGEPYGTLPVPSYAGYDFTGWYTEQNGGTEIKENTTVTVFGTQTLYAHWTPIHVHAYTQQVQKPEALKTPADCTNNAVYYLSCACGEVSTNDADTFTAANTALDHDWGAWTSNGNDTHTRVCKRDGSHTETDNCSGGTATCTAKAVCAVCGGEYGELLPHDFTAEIAEAKYLKSGATCTEKAVYYKSCAACGLSSAGTASEATFEAGNVLGHDWGAWTSNGNDTHTRVCKRDSSHTETDSCSGGTATCTAKAVCTVCGGEYGALAPNNHTGTIYWVTTETTHEGRYTCCEAVAVPMEPHAFGEWVVIYKATAKVWGIVERTCSVCGHQERKDVAPLDGAAAYVLKFETNGGSRISDVYAPYDTKIDLSKYEPVKDGYRFTGWYLDRMLTEGVTSVRMTKNATVYAGWRRTELPFIDVRGDDWFYDDVAYVYENGLMNGTSETTFSPYISTTRGMIVTILYRMEGKPAVFEACPFTDVKAGAYYERAIVWAAENGIVKGYGNGCFGPDDQITREQMAAILYRYAKNRGLDVSVGENTNILSYDDALDISEYAVPAMQWACGAQIIHGADGRLTPGAKATRAQVAAILHRFCENVLKP